MSMRVSFIFILAMVFLLQVFRHVPNLAEAVTCNPTALTPCAGAIMGSAAPTPACCSKLKEQKPCFCQYMKNPTLRGYIQSGNGRKVAKACQVPFPASC